MDRRTSWIGLALAVVAAVVAGVALLLRPEAPPPPVMEVDAAPAPAAMAERPVARDMFADAQRGGAYGGRVLDAETDAPIVYADVFLVGKAAPRTVAFHILEGEDPIEVQNIGDYETVGRVKTDAAGAYSIAGGEATVVALAAWAKGYEPTLEAHVKEAPLKPGRDHVFRLKRQGHLRGLVVDAVTKEPVPYAKVEVILQGKAHQDHFGADPYNPANSWPVFKSWVDRELGPAVWGLSPQVGDLGFTLDTKRDGKFDFGPLMHEVQVEVIITHPEYKWTEFDPEVRFESDRPDQQKPVRRRLVVPSGQIVEKTYALVKGKEIRGKVVDGEGKPIEGVDVHLEHVVQYAQHWMYRMRARKATTDAAGKFRVAGLDYGPYSLRMEHPSFDSVYWPGVAEGSDGVYRVEQTGGWVSGTVTGGPADEEGRVMVLNVFLQPRDGKGPIRPARVPVHEKQWAVEKVKPGRYAVWATAGDWVSAQVEVDVQRERGATAELVLARGGDLSVSVRARDGSPVDPVVVELDVVMPDGSTRPAASLVTRAGSARAGGLTPGRYRARARAQGFMPGASEPVDVAAEGVAVLPPIVLARQSTLQIKFPIRDEEGRAVGGDRDVHLSVSQDGQEFTPIHAVNLGRIPVPPGRVTLKATASDGREFEKTYDVEEGANVGVEIVLSRRP